MTELTTPSVSINELSFSQLRQITVVTDERIEEVNQLLADGWKLVSIGHTAQATVYVLGRMEEKPHRSTGFVPNERARVG
jgi:hypothetical protein